MSIGTKIVLILVALAIAYFLYAAIWNFNWDDCSRAVPFCH